MFVKVVFYCMPKMHGFSPKKIMKAPIAVEMPLYQVNTPVRTPRLVRVKCFTLLWPVGRCVFTRKNACCVCGYLFTLGKYSKSSQFDVLTALGYKLSLRTHLVREES